MTLKDILIIAKEKFLSNEDFCFKSTTDGVIYKIAGFENRYNGEPLDFIVDLHVGKHVHRNHRFCINEVLQDYIECENGK